MKINTKTLEDGTTVVEGMTSAELLALARKRADAGDGTFIKLAKRADEAAGFSNREAALQRACDIEVQRMRAGSIAKRDGSREPLSEYEQYRKSLHESAPAPRPTPAAPPRDEYYEKLWSDAQRIQEQMPELTVERIFAQLYEHPEEIAKRKARLVPQTTATDDDEAQIHDDEEMAGQMDDSDAADDDLGDQREEPGASTMCEGSPPGHVYAPNGNINHNSRMAAVGAPEGSYNDKKRPQSALKNQKRIDKALKREAKARRRALARG